MTGDSFTTRLDFVFPSVLSFRWDSLCLLELFSLKTEFTFFFFGRCSLELRTHSLPTTLCLHSLAIVYKENIYLLPSSYFNLWLFNTFVHAFKLSWNPSQIFECAPDIPGLIYRWQLLQIGKELSF